MMEAGVGVIVADIVKARGRDTEQRMDQEATEQKEQQKEKGKMPKAGSREKIDRWTTRDVGKDEREVGENSGGA